MEDSVAVLDAAASLIAEHGHCKSADAHNAQGRPVMPHDSTARTWGITGALVLVGKPATGRVFLDALHAFAKAVGVFGFAEVRDWDWSEVPALSRQLCERVWEWEDRPGRTAEHVLRAFDRAKENAA